MDGDLRVDRLERRVARLETRLNKLERLTQPGAAEAPPAPTAQPVVALPPAPPVRLAWPGEPAPRPGERPGVPVPVRPTLAAGQLWAPESEPGYARVAAPMPTAAAARSPELSARAAASTTASTIQAGSGPVVQRPAAESLKPAPAGWAVEPGPPRRPPIDLRELEERFAGRALAWIGGFALVAAALFFLSLAFSRGWITEPMRVAIGLVAGAVALSVGALSFDRRNPLLGNVLVAVGLGVVSISLFAATRAYNLVSPELGLAGALLAAVAAAVIAIRYDAREVAAFGLIASLIAPPVVGAPPNTLTLLFVAVTLVGTTAIALFRSWRWLPSIAFVLAAPQLASWLLGSPDVAEAMVALAGFWLVNVVAAGGEEVRIRRDDLRPSSATLVLADAAFLTWGGYVVLTGSLHAWLGVFIAVGAVAHLLVGGAFLRRQGWQHLFGNLVAGTGVALVALAAFEQFGAALVPVAWVAEGAALAWLAVRRLHVWSALASVTLGGLAVVHLVLVEYPIAHRETLPLFTTAWFHPEAAALAAVVLGIAVAGWFARVAWIRSVLVAVVAALVGYAAAFELSGPALATAWTGIAVAALLADVAVSRNGTTAYLAKLGAYVGVGLGTAAAAVLGVLALAHVVLLEYPLDQAGLQAAGHFATPWIHPEIVPVAALLAGALVVAWAWPARLVRSTAVGAATLLVGYVLTFEAGGALLVFLLWVVAMAATELDPLVARRASREDLAVLDRWIPFRWFGTAAGAWLRVTAIAVVVGVEYAPARLGGSIPAVPYAGEPALSLAIVLAGLVVVGARLGTRSIRSALAGIGVLLIAWSAPFELGQTARIALLSALLPLAVVADRLIARLPEARRFAFVRTPPEAGGLASAAGGLSWAAGLAIAVVYVLRPLWWGTTRPPAIPFSDETALVAVVLAGAAIAAASWAVSSNARQLALFGSLVPLGLAVPLEVYADFVVVLWLALAVAALAITRPGDLLRPASYGLAGLLSAGALAVAFAIVAPPDRLWVVDPAVRSTAPLLAGWWVALAAVAAVPYAVSRRVRLATERSALETLAAVLGVYAVSVGVVDLFQRQVGGAIPTEELAKQAQVALSVTWTAIGAVALGTGLRTRHVMPRHIGFGLLALATAKVFVVDLAAMDVAYRALVLAGLGVLLLVSAWLFSNLHGPRAGTHGPRPVG
jgi:hypothetical protein